MRFFFQHGKARAQNFHVAAEFIDDEALNAGPLLRLQQLHRAVQLGEDAAPVDIARQQDRRIHQLCQAHVDDIVDLEVDLRRAARPLDDDHVHLPGKAVVGGQNIGNEFFFVAEVIRRLHLAPHLAMDDDLAAHVAAGLEEDGVHPHIGLDACGLSLHHLGAAHFQAVPGDEAVERHILAFEGGHAVAVLGKNAAERCAQQAFARAAHGALHHDALGFAHRSTSRRVSKSLAFSGAVRTAVRYQLPSSPG